jgi:ABC-type antimicrobial peptide transport system permease subunit
MALVAAGTALGLIVASALGLGLASALHGMPRPDGIALALTTVFVAVVRLAACFVPVRRAFSADPVDILRLD